MPTLPNARHERFAQALAQGKTADEAYTIAGFKPNRGNASTLKQKQSIQNRVREILEWHETVEQKATERAITKLGVSKERVLAELSKIGFADIRKAVRWGRSPVDTKSENASPNGLGIFPVELVPSEEMDDDTAAAVAEVSLTQTGVKIKMYDKRAALVDIGKHLGMFSGKEGEDADEAPTLTINIAVRDAVGDVRVTKPEQPTGDLPAGAEHQV